MSTPITLNGIELFPRRYASGADLNGKSFTLEIERVEIEEMHDLRTHQNEEKLVIYFRGAQHGFVVRKHFAESIAAALGEPECKKWIGKRVMIYPFQTSLGTGVRAKAPGSKLDAVPAALSSSDDDGDA